MSLNDDRCATHKLAYTTRARARKAARRLRSKGREGLTAYGCRICGMFHVGRAPADEREAQREITRRVLGAQQGI